MAIPTPLYYYKLDSNSNDSLGANNGTDTAISYVSGKISNGASFNGSTSKINLSTTSSLTNQLTFNMWINPSSVLTRQSLFTKSDGVSDSTGSWSFEIGNFASKLTLTLFGGGTNVSVTSSTNLTASVFTMVTGTYDGTTIRLYINSTADNTIGATFSVNNITMDTALGYFGSLAALQYTGVIDEVGIWNSALSQSNITELYNGGAGVTYPFVNTQILNAIFFCP